MGFAVEVWWSAEWPLAKPQNEFQTFSLVPSSLDTASLWELRGKDREMQDSKGSLVSPIWIGTRCFYFWVVVDCFKGNRKKKHPENGLACFLIKVKQNQGLHMLLVGHLLVSVIWRGWRSFTLSEFPEILETTSSFGAANLLDLTWVLSVMSIKSWGWSTLQKREVV